MNITNRLGLPEPVVRMLTFGEREFAPDRISVTELIGPAWKRKLEREHWHEIEEDISDRLFAAYGSLMHLALERAGADNALQEERLAIEVDGVTVYGTPDLYTADGTIWDFKFVSVASTFDGPKPEWGQQLNCYAHLLRAHGFNVEALRVIALYRDWSPRRGGSPIAAFSLPLWGTLETEHWIATRLRAHLCPQPCTPEERWDQPTQYAITKRGNKRASRLCPTFEEAVVWAVANTPSGKAAPRWFDITQRPGESVRCARYCRVARFCDYGRRVLGEGMDAVVAV